MLGLRSCTYAPVCLNLWACTYVCVWVCLRVCELSYLCAFPISFPNSFSLARLYPVFVFAGLITCRRLSHYDLQTHVYWLSRAAEASHTTVTRKSLIVCRILGAAERQQSSEIMRLLTAFLCFRRNKLVLLWCVPAYFCNNYLAKAHIYDLTHFISRRLLE